MIEMEDFPPKIKDHVQLRLPETHKMWWVRGIVLDIEEVEHPTANPDKQNPGGRLRDTVLLVGDVDNENDGYEVRIEGVHHQVEVRDAISLLGHEPKSAPRVSYPRLYINHSTGEFERAYPISTRLTYGIVPVIEYKYWLSATTPANFKGKIRNVWVLLAAVCLPFVLLLLLSGNPILTGLVFLAGLLFLAPPLLLTLLFLAYARWLTAQPRFSFEEKAPPQMIVKNLREYVNFARTDLTPLYEWLGDECDTFVANNPDPDKDFVPIERGLHTIGRLQAGDAETQPFEVGRSLAQSPLRRFLSKWLWACANACLVCAIACLNAIAAILVFFSGRSRRRP